MGIVQGILGNLTEVSASEIEKEFGDYLMPNERVQMGFKLVRDVVILTTLRLIEFDKKELTGKKMRMKFRFLTDIVNVSCETAGFLLDDSELYITYIVSPYHKTNNLELATVHYEFPRKYDIKPFFQKLQSYVYENHKRMNLM